MSRASRDDDTLGCYLEDLRHRNETVRLKAAKNLRIYVEAEAGEMSRGAFSNFMTETTKRIYDLISSDEAHQKMGGIMAIDELIEVPCEDNETKTIRFANYLRMVFHQPVLMEASTLTQASRTLGHLARAGGSVTADFVEFELKRSIDWLQAGKGDGDAKRYAAVLVLKELAENSPVLFSPLIPAFFDHIWVAVQSDSKPIVREAAVEALRAVLAIIAKRNDEAWLRRQWFSHISDQISNGFRAAEAASIHGSLLVIGELLRNTGDFMEDHFEDTCQIVFAYKSHKNSLVQRATIQLLPQLAHFKPAHFVHHWLPACLSHLIGILTEGGDHYDTAFGAVGEIALAVGPAISPHTPQIIEHVSAALASQSKWTRGPDTNEALRCVSKLAKAVGPSLAPQIESLVDQMFAAGLSQLLLDVLGELARSTPSLLPAVQTRLLDCISAVLSAPQGVDDSGEVRCVEAAGTKVSLEHGHVEPADKDASTATSGVNASSPLVLALWALSTFGADDPRARSLLSTGVVKYFDHESPMLRREAALTVTRLLLPSAEQVGAALAHDPTMRGHALNSFSQRVVLCRTHQLLAVSSLLKRVLVLCVSDPHPPTRRSVLQNLDQRFDPFLCEPQCVVLLGHGLHDEDLPVRKAVVHIMGRLTRHNPSHVLPALRKFLIQILTELEYSDEPRQKEDATELLSTLSVHAQQLVEPYAGAVGRCLLKCLKEATAADGSHKLLSSLMGAFAQLSDVSGQEVKQLLPELVPLLVEAIKDHGGSGASKMKREQLEQAYKALRMVIENTGRILDLYDRHPSLLPFLIDNLRSDAHSSDWHQRQQILRCVGALGALEPAVFERLASSSSASKSLDPAAGLGDSPAIALLEGESNSPMWPWLSSGYHYGRPNPEATEHGDVLAAHAVAALLKMLKDASLLALHSQVAIALMKIFKSLDEGCLPFLPKMMAAFVQVARTSEAGERVVMMRHLAEVVRIVRSSIANYLQSIFDVVRIIWKDATQGRMSDDVRKNTTLALLYLLEEISLCRPHALKAYLGEVLPSILSFLQMNRADQRVLVLQVLSSLQTFGPALADFLHLVIPALVGRCEEEGSANEVRVGAVRALGQLSSKLEFSHLLGRVVHPLLRLLDAPSSSSDLRSAAVQTLSQLRQNFSKDFPIFEPQVRTVLSRQQRPAAPGGAGGGGGGGAGEAAGSGELLERSVSSHQLVTNDATATVEPSSSFITAVPAAMAAGERSMSPEASLLQQAGPPGTVAASTAAAVEGGAAASAAPWPSPRYRDPTLGGEVAGQYDANSKEYLPNQNSLRQAWEASHRSTKEDWFEWMRRFTLELLRESPSPALRACWPLAQSYYPLARELFHASFLSCWLHLYDPYQDMLVKSLETALHSPNVPPNILQALLNLAEFMDRSGLPLPIDAGTLAGLSEKCHAYAKALHYKEAEFVTSPASCVEALISINTQLQQKEAAQGILAYAQKHLNVELREPWYERLQRWEDALEAYELRQLEDPGSLEWTKSRMRCLHELGEWPRLSNIARSVWEKGTAAEAVRQELAPLGAAAEFHLRDWDRMGVFVNAIEGSRNISYEGFLYSAILAVHRENYRRAHRLICKAREFLDPELTALVGESYSRAYRTLVKVQQLTELEETIKYKATDREQTRQAIREMWSSRLRACLPRVDVWQAALQIRSIVIPPHEDLDTWLRFSALCRHASRLDLAMKALDQLRHDPAIANDPRLVVAYLKNQHAAGCKRQAQQMMRAFLQTSATGGSVAPTLLSRCHLKMGLWTKEVFEEDSKTAFFRDREVLNQVLGWFQSAIELNDDYKTWNAWALANFQVVESIEAALQAAESPSSSSASSAGAEGRAVHAVHAVKGFVKSIMLAKQIALQDLLRFTTLWFKYSGDEDVEPVLKEGLRSMPLSAWLQVMPQIMARLRSPNEHLRQAVHQLLGRVAKAYPQAVVFSLTVATKSTVDTLASSTRALLQVMRQEDNVAALVRESELVSEELIRISILWHERWCETLEEASRLYYTEGNPKAMIKVLQPLYEQMANDGPQTMRENAFQHAFSKDLREAWNCLKRYQRTESKGEIEQAWQLYYKVFQKIKKQVHGLSHLDMQSVSPRLLNARRLELAVPGTYNAEQPITTIVSFSPSIEVMISKQRPRILKVLGSDGRTYQFLLKGHEDLKQDERVMQLFGLINSLMEERREGTMAPCDLTIARFAVVPLSSESGLIGWVPGCDTLHQLIKMYRKSRYVELSVEYQLMRSMCSKCDELSVLQKVEVFRHALRCTSGVDLQRVLWLQSRNSEVWLSRRTTYCRSLAVMSMVGYILGLGDRHPSNLMIARDTGQVVHIDFGDCFEIAAFREKHPEKIPFRLTRMLLCALEVSGVEGNYRRTCELVMLALRNNKDAVMAMLEAFVFDPLITWRLLPPHKKHSPKPTSNYQTGFTASTYIDPNQGQQQLGLAIMSPLQTVGVVQPPQPAPEAKAETKAEAEAEAEAEEEVEAAAEEEDAPGEAEELSATLALPDEEFIETEEPAAEASENTADAPAAKPDSKAPKELTVAKADAAGPDAEARKELHHPFARGEEGTNLEEGEPGADPHMASVRDRQARQRELRQNLGPEGVRADPGVLTSTARSVTGRVYAKLTGTDFRRGEALSVEAQVERLLQESTSHENLCQCYVGWCPFW